MGHEHVIPAEPDNLSQDLLGLLHEASISDKLTQQNIMLKLLPYLVVREQKIFNHGYQAGRASV